MAIEFEHCISCNGLTDRAGKNDDSLYIDDSGPYCEDCFDNIITEANQLNEDYRKGKMQ